MKVQKVFEVCIDVPINKLYTDLDVTVLDLIKEKYEGRCYQSSLIMTVDSIIRRHDIVITKSSVDPGGTTNVIFQATVLVYQPGEIITGCTLRSIDASNRLICETDNTIIYMKGDDRLRVIKVDQMIPVKVINTAYTPNATQVSVNGVPAIPARLHKALRIEDDGTNMSEYYSRLLADIADEEKLKTKIDKKVWKFFDDLMWPFKSEKDAAVFSKTLSGGFSKKVRKNFKNNKLSGVVLIDPTIRSTLPEVYSFSHFLENANIKPVLMSSKDAYGLMLHRYLSALRQVREMCETYNTEKLRTSHKNVWTLLRRNN